MDKINFQNLPNTTTPINATNMNLLQTNVENAINSLNVYTSSEKAIGEWIDGKTIYRKVIELTTATGTNSFPISDVSSDIDLITKIDGIIIQPTTNHIVPVTYYYSSADFSNVYITGTNIVIRCGSSYGFGATKLILEYTKVSSSI